MILWPGPNWGQMQPPLLPLSSPPQPREWASVGLTGANSLTSVVCRATPCSWTGTGFPSGDTLIWTSDAGSGGNGPLTLTFAQGVSGAGALIQADGAGPFTAQIQAYNGPTLLGSFSVASDANGDATYIGVSDQTGPNITSITFSLTSCGGVCTDFAVDSVGIASGPVFHSPLAWPAPAVAW